MNIKKYLLSATSLILLLFWPTLAQEIPHPAPVAAVGPERFNTVSETNYLTKLALRGLNLDSQGLRIESLDGSVIFADHQSDVSFNPASVVKLATSFTALDRFGPDYHFETAFYADGPIDKKTKTLKGNLVLQSTGDPVLTTADVNSLVRSVIRAGISRVSGTLVVTGPFTYSSYYSTAQAMQKLGLVLRRMGVRVTEPARRGALTGTRIASANHTSSSLREILFSQNAHSSNPTAERTGEAVGGPTAVEQFLIANLGIPRDEVHITRTSGLDFNRITPRATVMVLRQLVQWLSLHGMLPEDLMPVAGIDAGTLAHRFNNASYRGGVVGKTGTLPGTDGGVSTLAGIVYTRDRGPILFAIFNTRGSVATYRKLQDALVEDLIAECGGIPEINASSRRSSN